MSLLNISRVGNNLIVLAILFGTGFMIHSKLDRETVKSTIEGIKRLFVGNKDAK